MERIAESLNEIIDIYGFGCEFSAEELFANFKDADILLESLTENGLVEKDPLSGNYYLSDIFTCNNFLSEHLNNEKDEITAEERSFEYEFAIKKEDLIGFSSNFKGFENIIRKIDVESVGDEFKISVKLKSDESTLEKFKSQLKIKSI